jgi:hypothetical protein
MERYRQENKGKVDKVIRAMEKITRKKNARKQEQFGLAALMMMRCC